MRSILKFSFLAIIALSTSCGPKVINKKVTVKDHWGLIGETTLKTDNFTVRLDWLEGPYDRAYSLARLTFSANEPAAELPSPVELVEVKPWMKIHGHGTGNKKVAIKQISPTVFEVSNIFFIMAGPWELEVTAKLQNDPKAHMKTIFTFEIPEKP